MQFFCSGTLIYINILEAETTHSVNVTNKESNRLISVLMKHSAVEQNTSVGKHNLKFVKRVKKNHYMSTFSIPAICDLLSMIKMQQTNNCRLKCSGL